MEQFYFDFSCNKNNRMEEKNNLYLISFCRVTRQRDNRIAYDEYDKSILFALYSIIRFVVHEYINRINID